MKYYTLLTNQAEFLGLVAIAQQHKIEICPTYLSGGYEEWPYFVYHPADNEVVGSNQLNPATVIPIKQMIEFLTGSAPVVELNSTYTAIIQPEKSTVKVGCQEIPFEAIERLYGKIQILKQRS